jgi:hypothetical protein
MTELTVAQAMEQAVRQAMARLADGAYAQGALESLWRTAFAAGVRSGQAAGLSPAIREPLRSELAGRIAAQAAREGWRYGAPWLHMPDMRAGARLAYGGVDSDGPNCDRLAVVTGVTGGARMQMEDTGERIRIPALCWTRPFRERPEDDDG